MDDEIDFSTYLRDPLPPALVNSAGVKWKAHWLAVEGVQPAIPENPAPTSRAGRELFSDDGTNSQLPGRRLHLPPAHPRSAPTPRLTLRPSCSSTSRASPLRSSRISRRLPISRATRPQPLQHTRSPMPSGIVRRRSRASAQTRLSQAFSRTSSAGWRRASTRHSMARRARLGA
jgi:hypothetical protein